MPVDAVIFDMDGVLVESEKLWDDAREELVKQTGGRWGANAQQAMMGMASNQWSVYVRDELQVPLTSEEITERILTRMIELYREDFPVIPGALDVVKLVGSRWPLAVASSSNRELIDLVIELGDLAEEFHVTVSSEEVGRGKPAPDVFLAAAEKLGVEPARCVVIEDSGNGLLAAHAAGMRIVAAPNNEFPPTEERLALADVVVAHVSDITPELIEQAAA